MAVHPWQLPYFELESAVAANHLEVSPVRGDETRAVGSRCQRDEHVEVQVSEFVGSVVMLGAHLGQNLARLQPVPLGG